MHAPTPAELDELQALLGPAGLLRGPAGLERYTEGARHGSGRAAAVARPNTVEQMSAVVAWAVRHRVRLVPQGANTGLVGASVPDESGTAVVVSTERLRRCSIDPVDRVAIVDAGVRLSELNEAALPHGLWFPIDLSADPSIGGMVATNTGGTRMHRYGDMRRRTLGLRAVLADATGTVVDDLRPLRKANDRLGITPLLVGSFGRLAVVVAAAVELAPRPSETAVALVGCRSGTDALDLLLDLEAAVPGQLGAFEVMAEPAARAGAEMAGVTWRPTTELTALVELSEIGSAVSADALAERLAGIAGDRAGGVVPAGTAWAVRHSITEGLRRTGPVLALDVSVPRPRLPELRTRAAAVVAATLPGAVCADFGHWGDGGMHLNLMLPEGADPRGVERCRRAVWALVDELGGSFSAEHGLGPANAAAVAAFVPGPVQAISAAMTSLFDPIGVLQAPSAPSKIDQA